jgi:hypothetical protein
MATQTLPNYPSKQQLTNTPTQAGLTFTFYLIFRLQAGLISPRLVPCAHFIEFKKISTERENQPARETSLHKRTSLPARETQPADKGPAHGVWLHKASSQITEKILEDTLLLYI